MSRRREEQRAEQRKRDEQRHAMGVERAAEFMADHQDDEWDQCYPDDVMAEDDKQRAADLNEALRGIGSGI